MICVIDNHDSFTYNLVQILWKAGRKVEVIKNDQISPADFKARAHEFSSFLISPGPGSPEESGLSLTVMREFHNTHPILGVCLGHQVIAQFFGATVKSAGRILHGHTSPIHHIGQGLYSHQPQGFRATRYHSLIVENLPPELELTSWAETANGQKEIMGFRHRELPIEGVQFHPESILSEGGEALVMSFFKD